MGRKPTDVRLCAVCGDRGFGVNFGAPSCVSCKAFFRRNGLRTDKRCVFTNACEISKGTRKFCGKCRLEKCFAVGMRKELILSEEKREEIKAKIRWNKERKARQLEETVRKWAQSNGRGRLGERPESSNTSQFSGEGESSTSNTSDAADYLGLDAIFDTDELLFTPGQASSVVPEELEAICSELLRSEASTPSTGGQLVPFHSQFDSILEFTPQLQASFPFDLLSPQSTALSFPYELGFPEADLLAGEVTLLRELYTACSVLKNPYKRLQEWETLDFQYSSRMTEFILYRLISMSKKLVSFTGKPRELQGLMLKHSLVEMMVLQSVLMYSEYRQAWAFVDDNQKTTVMFRMSNLAPYCYKCGFERHRVFPRRFRDEWRDDSLIFHLLTVIILFTPRPQYGIYQHLVEEDHQRYTRLLHRYLRIKYSTHAEAELCFTQLTANIFESLQLSEDIFAFYQTHRARFTANPFFVELLNLPSIGQAGPEASIVELSNVEKTEGDFQSRITQGVNMVTVDNSPVITGHPTTSTPVLLDANSLIGNINFWL